MNDCLLHTESRLKKAIYTQRKLTLCKISVTASLLKNNFVYTTVDFVKYVSTITYNLICIISSRYESIIFNYRKMKPYTQAKKNFIKCTCSCKKVIYVKENIWSTHHKISIRINFCFYFLFFFVFSYFQLSFFPYVFSERDF